MIGITGINHKTTPQDVRQLFSFSKEEVVPFSELVREKTDVSEIVILSTCHRTELYYYINCGCSKEVGRMLTGILHKYKNIKTSYENSFYQYDGAEAVKHLFRVTSGMDSMVIGEDQIVKQVKEAYMQSTEAVLTEAVLMRLFQKSFETSKKIRTEARLNQGPASLSRVAVELCSQIYPDLANKAVMFVGSGETGQLALHYMVKKGVKKTYVSNRTAESAASLGCQYRSEVVDFNEFKNHLHKCDIVITATAAPDYLIKKHEVEQIQSRRNFRPQVYIDLSIPRNIESSVADINGVDLFGVDDMQPIVDSKSEKTEENLALANEIIETMAGEYMLWYECLSLRPVIKTITKNLRKARESEIAVYKNTLDNGNLELVDEYTSRITEKYIGLIIKNLRNASESKPPLHSLDLISRLFKIDDE